MISRWKTFGDKLYHLRHTNDSMDVNISTFMSVGHCDARHELFLAVGLETVPHHYLIFSQLRFQVQGITPVKRNWKTSAPKVSECVPHFG
jgi:hypothetical protein